MVAQGRFDIVYMNDAFSSSSSGYRPTESDSETLKAIYVAFDEEGAKGTEKHNDSVLKTNQIKSHALSETCRVGTRYG